ncbi:MAG: hypothetical protein MI723_13375 [Caulobacterales bacterium]|nr:hypothetical protein [Caulobacterales bacterium]
MIESSNTPHTPHVSAIEADADEVSDYLSDLGEEAARIARAHKLGLAGMLFSAAAAVARRRDPD